MLCGNYDMIRRSNPQIIAASANDLKNNRLG